MSTIAAGILIALVTCWAVYRTIRKFQKGGGCCGEHEAAVKRIAVTDRNKSHYLYALELDIGGMTCENCAIRVENALNAIDGVWASVDISDKKAAVRCKQKPDEKQLRQAVAAAGYVVTKIRS